MVRLGDGDASITVEGGMYVYNAEEAEKDVKGWRLCLHTQHGGLEGVAP